MSQVLRLDLPAKPAAGKRGEQRVLHDVLGRIAVAQLQLRDPQQVAAMRFDLAGEVFGHGARRGQRAGIIGRNAPDR